MCSLLNFPYDYVHICKSNINIYIFFNKFNLLPRIRSKFVQVLQDLDDLRFLKVNPYLEVLIKNP